MLGHQSQRLSAVPAGDDAAGKLGGVLLAALTQAHTQGHALLFAFVEDSELLFVGAQEPQLECVSEFGFHFLSFALYFLIFLFFPQLFLSDVKAIFYKVNGLVVNMTQFFPSAFSPYIGLLGDFFFFHI